MKASGSERDGARKDDIEDDDDDGDDGNGTVGGLGEGNFVDATFPAGERRSLTGHRTERVSAGQKRSPKLPETAVTARTMTLRARRGLLSNVNTV